MALKFYRTGTIYDHSESLKAEGGKVHELLTASKRPGYNIVMSHLDPTKSARKAFGLHRINESSALYRHGANLDD